MSYKDTVGCDAEYKDRFDEAVKSADQADYVLLCLGEDSYSEKPGDLNDLYLNPLQTELACEILKKNKKNTVLVLSEGRPRIISGISSGMEAIVQAYLPGMYGAEALSCILSGEVNPSGRLPYTYPAFPNSLVPYYHKYSEEEKKSDGVYDYSADYNPQYCFGYGLSYTSFAYSDFRMDKAELPVNSVDDIVLSVKVTNTGRVAGKEVVQLYSSDLYASVIPDVKRLRRFEKISLNPGETKTVSFRLKLKDLSFVNGSGQTVVEPGDFKFLVGSSSDDIKSELLFRVK